MRFYTWGDRECCLPPFATRATLRDHLPALRKGATLIVEEVVGPHSGRPEDADPLHRHALRLVADAELATDPVSGAAITHIVWSESDAIPFPLCLSARTTQGYIEDITVARGNIVLADFGHERRGETVPAVPADDRFRPELADGPLTQAPQVRTEPVDGITGEVIPAADAMTWSPADVLPDVALVDERGRRWMPQRDLLGSGPLAREFVVETEDDGRASIRFGDDHHGMRPDPRAAFTAIYRVGNGTAANVGADALSHVFTDIVEVVGVRNPLPARGGVDPEPLEDVRLRAPQAFRELGRAVTEADYAEISRRHPAVQRAAANFRWTGSWQTLFVAADPLEPFRQSPERVGRALVNDLEPFRMAGHDVAVESPRYVPLEIEMFVCVHPAHFQHDVRRALLDVFTRARSRDGRPGLFHPDAWTFGQPVHLSPLYAAAAAVRGVESVRIDVFQRYHDPSRSGLTSGTLPMDALEIPRLDNDLAHPERGEFRLTLGGGRR
jgi:hypothetical protein